MLSTCECDNKIVQKNYCPNYVRKFKGKRDPNLFLAITSKFVYLRHQRTLFSSGPFFTQTQMEIYLKKMLKKGKLKVQVKNNTNTFTLTAFLLSLTKPSSS